MPKFKLHGKEISSIFQLLGYKENDISHSTAWVLGKSPGMLELLINEVFGQMNFHYDEVEIYAQVYDVDSGITDIEITDGKEFYIIIEAKRGWILPSKQQLLKYSQRESFIKSAARNKVIITLSECSKEYAEHNLQIKSANGYPIRHLAWKDINRLAENAYITANHSEKKILKELQLYLQGLMSMQNQTSNEVYVVSLGSGKANDSEITWIDIVREKNKYFHPLGNGWPKEPPNYIGFRYQGKLQSIHHIESYVISTNMNDEIPEMPNTDWDPHFIYNLGPAIIPSKEIKTGNIYPSGRVWCHLDALLTCETISEARDLTKVRMGYK